MAGLPKISGGRIMSRMRDRKTPPLYDYDEASRRALAGAGPPLTMRMLDDACAAIGRLGLSREEVERRWPDLAVTIAIMDPASFRLAPDEPPILDERRLAEAKARVAAAQTRVKKMQARVAPSAAASMERALRHELAPEPRPRVDRRLVGVLVVSGLVGLLVALLLRAGGF